MFILYTQVFLRRFATLTLLLLTLSTMCEYQLSLCFFYKQQNVLAKTLCVQKNQVENTCQGHCQLAKKTSLIVETQRAPYATKSTQNNIPYSFKAFLVAPLSDLQLTAACRGNERGLFSFYQTPRLTKGINSSLLKPPCPTDLLFI